MFLALFHMFHVFHILARVSIISHVSQYLPCFLFVVNDSVQYLTVCFMKYCSIFCEIIYPDSTEMLELRKFQFAEAMLVQKILIATMFNAAILCYINPNQ